MIDFFANILLLQQYNSRIVIVSLLIYGLGSGMVGVYMMLSKRSMIADAFSHATLPGIVVAFLISSLLGNNQYKNIWLLLFGALLSTFAALLLIQFFHKFTFLKNDAIFGIIISVFFGVGIVFMSIASKINAGSASGLLSYIYGNPTSLQKIDTIFFLICSIIIIVFVIAYRRQLLISCFDPRYGQAIGINTRHVDFFLLAITLVQTIVGIQAMGIILASAILIIPPVSAHFWSYSLRKIMIISIFFCTSSVVIGGIASATYTFLPAGATIILVAEVFFIISVLFGSNKGIIRRAIDTLLFRIKIISQHILRQMYEFFEEKYIQSSENNDIHNVYETVIQHGKMKVQELKHMLAISAFSFTTVIFLLKKCKLVTQVYDDILFTRKGFLQATKFVRNHRLWEMYLLKNTQASTEDIDFSADAVEHVLGEETVQELEQALMKTHKYQHAYMYTPHKIDN